MCGRFAVTTDPARLAEQIDAVDETGTYPDAARPNYNVAPTTDIVAVVARHDEPDDRQAGAERPGVRPAATRRLRLMRWGLLPSWVKADAQGRPLAPGKAKTPMINARAESVTTSPAYRAAAAHKRCLVPMDGYYEWKRAETTGAGPKLGRKTPFFFFRPDGRPLLVAGLWSVWKPSTFSEWDSAGLLTCTVITADAVGEFAGVHGRMPLVLAEADWDRWLDPDAPAPENLLAGQPDVAGIAMREVSTLVNNVANNGPELIEPAKPGNQPAALF